MIKAIIFDFGSVIYKTDWEKLDAYFKKLNGFSIRIAESKDEELIKIYRDSDIGKQEYVKFFYHLEPNIKDIDKIIKDYKKAYGKFKKINRELLKIISFLKKKYLIFGFSDIKKEHYEANKECGIYDCFEEVFASFKFGVLKCDAGAFQRLEKELKKFNLKPENCLFIDDWLPNIENAKKTGFKTIYYEDFPKVGKLKKEIENILEIKIE